MLATAILLSMVLYLVDKNGQWAAFWKTVKFTFCVLLIASIAGGGYYWHETRVPQEQAKKTVAAPADPRAQLKDGETLEPIPPQP